MDRIESIILSSLLYHDEYMRRVIPFLKAEYFADSTDKLLFTKIQDFTVKYNALPSKEALSIAVQNDTTIGEKEYESFMESLQQLEPSETRNDAWLIEQSEKFCKDRAIYLAIAQSIRIIEGQEKNLTSDALPSLLQEALSVGFDLNIGHDYDENGMDRYDFYHSDVERIPFDIEILNTITKGGVPRKTLNVILGGVGVGKSLVMCHLASAYKTIGKNVLYITMEMSEEKIAERIDANLMNVSIDELANLSKSSFESRLKKIKDRAEGRLIIKEYPTASAHSGHFRALLNELWLKKEFKPDVIFIDYLNICSSARFKLSGSVNTYVYALVLRS
jgi:replicative DNA helicase